MIIIRLHSHISSKVPIALWGDERHLSTVQLQLITNAPLTGTYIAPSMIMLIHGNGQHDIHALSWALEPHAV